MNESPDAQKAAGERKSVSPASGLDIANMQGRAVSQLKKQQMLMGNFAQGGLWEHSPSKDNKRPTM